MFRNLRGPNRLGALALALIIVVGTASAESPKRVGRALLTFYWVIDEGVTRYEGRQNAVLRDPNGRVIAHTTARFKKDLVMEGTGLLRDGRTVIFERRVRGESRFRVTKLEFGIGSTGCALEPFRSVAVDAHFIKPGSTISVPQLKGTRLPDGTVHDGVFFAVDRGHFRGQHIDVFVGAGPHATRPFIRKGYPSRSRVMVYLLDAPPIDCDAK